MHDEPAMNEVLAGTRRAVVVLGKCEEMLRALPDNSVDSVVTDPPSGISFMGRDWDSDRGGRDRWIAWLDGIMRECLRVLKPGGHAVVWALPRTSHWTATGVENAGFEVRDIVQHLFGSGYPKSLDVSKAIDAHAGAVRGEDGAPVTDEAERWTEFGTALKPAAEHWVLARKPFAGTVVDNVLEHGVGAINIGACRVGWADEADEAESKNKNRHGDFGSGLRENNVYGKDAKTRAESGGNYDATGRWPPNVVFSHAAGCELIGEKTVKTPTSKRLHDAYAGVSVTGFLRGRSSPANQHGDENGEERIEDWRCASGCAVAALDAQSGALRARGNQAPEVKTDNGIADGQGRSFLAGTREPYSATYEHCKDGGGGASRFFPVFAAEDEVGFRYVVKPAVAERLHGCWDLYWCRDPERPSGARAVTKEEWSALPEDKQMRGNIHITLKPLELAKWLVRLVTPPGGVVLDPFCGSGTVLVAALTQGFRAVGIEMDEDHVTIAHARAAHAEAHPAEYLDASRRPKPATPVDPRQTSLF